MLKKLVLGIVFLAVGAIMIPSTTVSAATNDRKKECVMASVQESIVKNDKKVKLCSTMNMKITICHANNGIKQYVEQSVSYNSIVKNNGHAEHQDGRDIIPAFEYIKAGVVMQFAGLNLTPANVALLENGCIAIPTKPADKQTTRIATRIDCTTKMAVDTTITTTIGTRLVDNVWVELDPIETIAVAVPRPATDAELKDCPVTVPEQPTDEVTIVSTKSVDCTSRLTTFTTTTTTFGTKFIDNEWVTQPPVVRTIESILPATEAELATCPVTPTTPSDDNGDVLGDSTVGGAGQVVQELPFTSGSNSRATVLSLSAIATVIALMSFAVRSALSRQL